MASPSLSLSQSLSLSVSLSHSLSVSLSLYLHQLLLLLSELARILCHRLQVPLGAGSLESPQRQLLPVNFEQVWGATHRHLMELQEESKIKLQSKGGGGSYGGWRKKREQRWYMVEGTGNLMRERKPATESERPAGRIPVVSVSLGRSRDADGCSPHVWGRWHSGTSSGWPPPCPLWLLWHGQTAAPIETKEKERRREHESQHGFIGTHTLSHTDIRKKHANDPEKRLDWKHQLMSYDLYMSFTSNGYKSWAFQHAILCNHTKIIKYVFIYSYFMLSDTSSWNKNKLFTCHGKNQEHKLDWAEHPSIFTHYRSLHL